MSETVERDRPTAFVPLVFPPWLRWGQRSGASIDNDALAAVYPDHRHYRRFVVNDADGTIETRLVGEHFRCGWCGGVCAGRRTSWCSAECREQFYRVWSWGAVAQYVRERDGDVCRRCGTTDPGVPKGNRYHAWDVDHVMPVADGGTDDPENLRLVCATCHVAIGYEQRSARKHRDQQTLELEAAR